MVESERVPRKGRIRVSIEKLSRQIPEKGQICVSIENLSNPGEYLEKVESVRVPRNCAHEYQKMVESVSGSVNARIRASTGKR